MVLVAIDFTEYDLTHMDEHTLACNIRDYLLSKYVDDKCDYKFAVKEIGKPYIIDSDITYSVSHTNGCIACALSVDKVYTDLPSLPDVVTSSGVYVIEGPFPCEIGLDVEICDKYRSPERISSIASRYYSDEEQLWLNDALDKNSEFYRIWTRKESFVKCTGDGMKSIASTDTANLPVKTHILEFKLQNGDNVCAGSICVMEK